jgi:hypothetical protein
MPYEHKEYFETKALKNKKCNLLFLLKTGNKNFYVPFLIREKRNLL